MADAGCFGGGVGAGAGACIRGIRRESIYSAVISVVPIYLSSNDVPRSGGDQALRTKTSRRCPVVQGVRCCPVGARRGRRRAGWVKVCRCIAACLAVASTPSNRRIYFLFPSHPPRPSCSRLELANRPHTQDAYAPATSRLE